MKIFITYYVISVLYCFIMASRKWSRDVTEGGLGITPAFDSLAIVLLGPVLAPIDLFLTWKRIFLTCRKTN
jgi:hypothetical protein